MRFRYEGFNKEAQIKRGFIDAQTHEEAATKLRDLGVFAQQLEPDSQEPMKAIFDGGEALNPEPVVDKPVGVSGQADTPTDWRTELKSNIEAIKKVNLLASDLLKDVPEGKTGLKKAMDEMVLQLVLRAVKSARWEA